MTAKADPQTPAWVLDAVEDVIHRGEGALMDAMLACGEDITDTLLWQHRKSQFLSLLVSKAEARLSEYRQRLNPRDNKEG